jgi:hypothetical protein
MDLSQLSDEALFGKVEALSETERFSLIDLLIHLGELDQRNACQKRGYASVFAYLTRRLSYSESDAIRRVRAARAARKYPSILRMLASGELNLVSVSMLHPLLTSENHERLLRRAARRSTREVERMVAELAPVAAEPRDRIRLLPPLVSSTSPTLTPDDNSCAMPPELALPAPTGVPAPDLGLPAEPGRAALEPAVPVESNRPSVPTETRVVFTFTASAEVQSWFETARDLLRHSFPMGRMEEVIGEALRRLVQEELPSAPMRRPQETSPDSRHIPKWVQDEVWRRDSGRCAFIGPEGVRCGETAWLEFDHIVPFALGGPSNDPANIRLLCRAHNQSERWRVFGQSSHSFAPRTQGF